MPDKNPCKTRGFFASRKESNTRKCREYKASNMMKTHNVHHQQQHKIHQNLQKSHAKNPIKPHLNNIKANTQANTHPTTRHLNTARQQMF